MSKFYAYAAIILTSLFVGAMTGGMLVAGWQSQYANWRLVERAWDNQNHVFAKTQNNLLAASQSVLKPFLINIEGDLCVSLHTMVPETNSLIELFNSLGHEGSWDERAALAVEFGLPSYGGSAEQNESLVKAIKLELLNIESEVFDCPSGLVGVVELQDL